MQSFFTYLALGDSYTIGESVLLQHNFPYQTVQLLRRQGHHFSAPEIIAKTGWTTDELEEGMRHYKFLPKYDFVTLLIGVNNQYRGREVMEYKMKFEELLKKAIAFSGNRANHVAALSIPDYTVTPFAQNMNREKIAREIEVYNSVAKAVSVQYKVHFINITTGSREAEKDPALVAQDQLHPSEKEYKKWAEKLTSIITLQLK